MRWGEEGCFGFRLFRHVSQDLLSKPLYRKFLALLDNYTPSTGQREYETAEERREVDDFLEEVLKTEVFNKTYEFLRNHGKTVRLLGPTWRSDES